MPLGASFNGALFWDAASCSASKIHHASMGPYTHVKTDCYDLGDIAKVVAHIACTKKAAIPGSSLRQASFSSG